jgi:sulfur carrier protein ThiS
MKIVVNGRLIETSEGSTLADVRGQMGLPASESFVEVSGTSAKRREDSEPIREDAKYRSIPPIHQG